MTVAVRFVDFPRCWASIEELEAGVPEDELDDYFAEYEEFIVPRHIGQPRVFFDPLSQQALAITPVDSEPVPFGLALMRVRWFFGEDRRQRLELRLAEIGQNIHTMRAQGHRRWFVRTVAWLQCWAAITGAACRSLADIRGLVARVLGWRR